MGVSVQPGCCGIYWGLMDGWTFSPYYGIFSSTYVARNQCPRLTQGIAPGSFPASAPYPVVSDLDVDIAGNLMVWATCTTSGTAALGIMSCPLAGDGGSLGGQTVVLDSPIYGYNSKIALDRINQNIYFTAGVYDPVAMVTNYKLYMCPYTGGTLTALSAAHNVNLTGLTVDAAAGYVFYSGADRSGSVINCFINRCALDGSGDTTIASSTVAGGSYFAYGAMDVDENLSLLFTSATPNNIYKCDYSGGSSSTLSGGLNTAIYGGGLAVNPKRKIIVSSVNYEGSMQQASYSGFVYKAYVQYQKSVGTPQPASFSGVSCGR